MPSGKIQTCSNNVPEFDPNSAINRTWLNNIGMRMRRTEQAFNISSFNININVRDRGNDRGNNAAQSDIGTLAPQIRQFLQSRFNINALITITSSIVPQNSRSSGLSITPNVAAPNGGN